MKINKNNNFFFFIILFFIIYIFHFSFVDASTQLYFEKNMDQIKKGDMFQATLVISTDKSINVVDGTIIFDKDKLSINSVETDESIFSMWAKEPIFDNKIGELSFVGGISGGIKTNKSEILKVNFKAIKSGSVSIGFKDVFSVFLNDGLGTRLNPWFKPLSFSIQDKYIIPILYMYGILIFFFVLLIIFIIIKLLNKNKKNE